VLQAGVVDQDVDVEVQRVHRGEVGQVDGDRGAAHRRGHLLRRLGVPVDDDDVGAGRGEPDGAGAPDAGGAAGDESASSEEGRGGRHAATVGRVMALPHGRGAYR
jgi:hypothetical protein